MPSYPFHHFFFNPLSWPLTAIKTSFSLCISVIYVPVLSTTDIRSSLGAMPVLSSEPGVKDMSKKFLICTVIPSLPPSKLLFLTCPQEPKHLNRFSTVFHAFHWVLQPLHIVLFRFTLVFLRALNCRWLLPLPNISNCIISASVTSALSVTSPNSAVLSRSLSKHCYSVLEVQTWSTGPSLIHLSHAQWHCSHQHRDSNPFLQVT